MTACRGSRRLAAEDVEFAGCARVLSGPVCELSRWGQLTLWVHVPAQAKLVVTVDGRHPAFSSVAVAGGQRLTLTMPTTATATTLLIQATMNAGTAQYRLALRPTSTSVPAVAAQATYMAGLHATAESILTQALQQMEPLDRALALGLLARMALADNRFDDAVTLLQQALALHRDTSCVSCAADDGATLLHTLIYHGRQFQRAEQLLAELAPTMVTSAEANVWLSHSEGLLALERGDSRSAMRALETARAAATRLGLTAESRSAEQLLALASQTIGNQELAATLISGLRRSLPADANPCERATLLSNAGWVELLRADAAIDPTHLGHQSEDDLHAAVSLFDTTCSKPIEAANALVNLALWAVVRGNPTLAQQYLLHSMTRLPHPEVRLRLWQIDVAGRIALMQARPAEAVRLYTELDALGADVDAIEARWRAALGRAHALLVMGQSAEALATFAHAEELLDETAQRVALGDGRDAFFGFHARGTRDYIEALLVAGRVRAAAWVARHGRSRMLTTLARLDRLTALSGAKRAAWNDALRRYQQERDQLDSDARNEWQLSGDALAALRLRHADVRQRLREALDDAFSVAERVSFTQPDTMPTVGELVLVYYPLGATSVGFAIDNTAAKEARFSDHDIDQPARLLLPFDKQIARAQRIRVIAAGRFDSIDFHTLAWREEPLLAHVPVAYGTDIPVTAGSTDEQRRRATVVGDPLGNLPASRREAQSVRDLLVAHGWRVALVNDEQATREALLQAAETSSVLHYAGHGAFATDAWQSGLVLFGRQLFSLGDILTLPRSPALVVLAACDTARTPENTVSGLGVAQAFIIGGALATVAANRVVDDVDSNDLMHTFYEHLDAIDGWSAAGALRLAQIDYLKHRGPEASGTAFRVLLP